MTDEKFAHNVARSLYWDAFRQGEHVVFPMSEAAVQAREKSIKSAKQRIMRRLGKKK
jgi:hypothetical protein